VAEIPWGHNVILLEQLKDPAQRLWYAHQTTLNGWSRSMLEHWIESDLYSRQGKSINNFKSTLLEVEGEDFYIDLRLRCYVVVDLKVEPFKPEFAGKMNFYLSAVDDRMRHADDKPSIGLILCKTRKKTIAEYALRDLAKPVGVARYVTRLVESLPKELAGALPSVEEIEAELAKGVGDGE
jgi:hypothetical protein